MKTVCATETGFGWWTKTDIATTLRAEGENRPSRPSTVIVQFRKVAKEERSKE